MITEISDAIVNIIQNCLLIWRIFSDNGNGVSKGFEALTLIGKGKCYEPIYLTCAGPQYMRRGIQVSFASPISAQICDIDFRSPRPSSSDIHVRKLT